ncbi:MAG: outer membrane beta-barrel domain-containing protein [Myxococcota bacterium]|nr:outer membrane beta-barrel domain-containing protein [Myxococcota bacterium]
MNLLLAAALSASPALAQDTVDLGTLKNEEISVVQKILYPKTDRSEMSVSLGVIAFDPFLYAPKLQGTYGKHMSETMSWEAQLGVGYGLPNAAYREVTSVAYGLSPETYRYLGSLTAGITWSPIYAKMNWQGERIYHHDVYIPIVGGVTVEQLTWGEKYLAVAPTVGIGIGMRVFRGDDTAIRIEIRDDIMAQSRQQSGTWALKQNVGIHVGFSRLGEAQ